MVTRTTAHKQVNDPFGLGCMVQPFLAVRCRQDARGQQVRHGGSAQTQGRSTEKLASCKVQVMFTKWIHFHSR